MSSKRKPYQHLKLSSIAFWSMPVRYLKEFFGKESYLEKPYRGEGRSEMHQAIPVPPTPSPPRPPGPPIPVSPRPHPTPPRPPFPTPSPNPIPPRPRRARPPIPPTVKWPGRPRITTAPDYQPPFSVQALCSIRYNGPECLDDGQDAIVLAASDTSGRFIWGYEISDPGYISVSNSNRSDKAEFGITAHGAPDPPVDVEICFFMAKLKTTTVSTYSTSYRSKGIGMENRPDTTIKTELLVSKCGCVTIIVPCDPCIRDDYLAPSIEKDQGTLAPGTAPCASSASTKTLTVQNGAGPFTWAVSGTGFCLAYVTTTGRSNILRADNTACGPATITITDYCSNSCTCEVRGTTGTWCSLPEYTGNYYAVPCLLEGIGTYVHPVYTRTEGKYRQEEKISTTKFTTGDPDCTCSSDFMINCVGKPESCLVGSTWYDALYLLCSQNCFISNRSGSNCLINYMSPGYRYGREWKCAC